MKKQFFFAAVVIFLGVFAQSCVAPVDPNDSWESNKPTVVSVVSSIDEYYYIDPEGQYKYQYGVETDITLKVRNRTDKVSVQTSSIWLETRKRGVTDILLQTTPNCFGCNQPWAVDNWQIKQFNDNEYTIKVYSWVEQQPLGNGYKSFPEFKSDTTLTLKLMGLTVNNRFNYKFPIQINGKNEKVEVSYAPDIVQR